MDETPRLLDDFFRGRPGSAAIFERIDRAIADFGSYEVRVSKSQVAFRRRQGFAYVWLPDTYLRGPNPEAVLSIGLPYELTSPRFKEVVDPAPSRWMHHLEVRSTDDIDEEVISWLRAAFEAAG